MKNPHVMSKYATELDCLRARDEWFQQHMVSYEDLLRLSRDTFEELFGADMEYCMMMDGKEDQIDAIKHAKMVVRELRRRLGDSHGPSNI